MIRTLYALAIITLSVILALGFTGRFLPLGDSFAVFRLPNLFLLAVLVLCLPKTKFFYVALGCLILGSLSIALHYIPQKTTQQNAYRLYQKNMSYRVNPDALRADILAADADFITLQETAFLEDTEHDFEFISQLKPQYPYQLNCPSARSGLIVMSRWPSTGKGKCFNVHGFGAMNVETPAGRLWLISVHLYWPFPHAQAPQVKSAAQHIQRLGGPKMIAGDFNMVPWSHSIKALERASDTRIARPVIPSFDLPYIRMRVPIDHVLLPAGAKVKTERRDKKASDHYGVLATFNLPE